MHGRNLSWKYIFTTWSRPFYMLFTEPIIAWLSAVSGFSDSLIFTFLRKSAYRGVLCRLYANIICQRDSTLYLYVVLPAQASLRLRLWIHVLDLDVVAIISPAACGIEEVSDVLTEAIRVLYTRDRPRLRTVSCPGTKLLSPYLSTCPQLFAKSDSVAGYSLAIFSPIYHFCRLSTCLGSAVAVALTSRLRLACGGCSTVRSWRPLCHSLEATDIRPSHSVLAYRAIRIRVDQLRTR